MKEFQSIILKFVKNHERHKKYLAFLMALSIMVSFAVPFSLIMPAISMTAEDAQYADDMPTMYSASGKESHTTRQHPHGPARPNIDNPYFSGVANEIPGADADGNPSKDFTNNITSTSVWVVDADKDKYQIEQSGNSATIKVPEGSDYTSVNLRFELQYTISSTENGVNTVTKERPCIYYQLPDGVTVPSEYYGNDKIVIDDGVTAGYFSINEQGLIVIQFLDSYIDDKIAHSPNFTGTITFNGTVSRDNDADGDRVITIGDLTLDVQFPDKNYSIIKSGSVKSVDETGKPYIEWTVSLSSYYNQSLNGYKLVDEKFKDSANITINPSGLGNFDENGNFVFDADPPRDENGDATVTFTYKEYIDDINKDYQSGNLTKENEAKLLSPDSSTEVAKDKKSVTLLKPNIYKSGKPDYDVTGAHDKTVYWNIDVSSPYGTSLEGYQVSDAKFTDAHNLKVTSGGKDVAFELQGNTIVFGEEAPSSVVITYEQDITDVSSGGNNYINVDNTATLLYPNGNEANKGSTSVNYNSTNPYKLDKNGSHSYDTGLITWTVNATLNDRNNKKITLNGYELTDPSFENIDLSNINISSANFGYSGLTAEYDAQNDKIVLTGWSSSANAYVEYASITKNGDTLTITEAAPFSEVQDESKVLGIHDITFTYTTEVKNAGDDGTEVSTNGSGEKVIKNSVSDNHDNNENGEVTISTREQLVKTLKSNANDMEYVSDMTENEAKILKWELNLIQDTGFSSIDNDKVLVDVMNATNGGDHYLNIETQKNNIKLYVKKSESGEEKLLTEGSDYTIEFYDSSGQNADAITEGHAKQFRIEFNSNIDDEGYKYMRVEYETTADVSGVNKPAEGESTESKFSNNASFGNSSSGDTNYTFELRDDSMVENVSISVKKNWVNDNNDSERPSSIKYMLQRKLGTNGEWETIYKNSDGNWVAIDDSVDESSYIQTLTHDGYGNWHNAYTWNDLPKETAEHNDLYYYRAVEVDVPDGYNVSYSNENGINSGEFTITNTKKASIEKIALDKNGNPLQSNELLYKDLQKTTYNGTEYYVFGWQINLPKRDATITDTISEDSVLLEGYDLGETNTWGHSVKYPRIYTADGSSWTLEKNKQSGETYTYSGNTIEFKFYANNSKIVYYTGIPVSTFDNSYNESKSYRVDNTVIYDGDSQTVSVNVVEKTIGGPDISDAGLLGKSVNDEAGTNKDNNIYVNGGVVKYVVYVNPEGKKLSNTDEYDLTDSFMFDSYAGLSAEEIMEKLSARLDNITVEEVNADWDENGNVTGATVIRPLNNGEYRYTVDYNNASTESIPLNLTSNRYDNTMYIWDANDKHQTINEEVSIELLISGTANKTGYYLIDGNKVTLDFDSNGHATYVWKGKLESNYSKQLTIKEQKINGSGEWVDLEWNDDKTFQDVVLQNASYEKMTSFSAAKINLTVPDETALKITYSYKLSKDGIDLGTRIDGVAWGGNDVFTASNSISLNTGNAQATDSTDDQSFIVNSTAATVTTGNLPQIVKYDVNDYSLQLNAGFLIAKYEGDNNWNYAVKDQWQKYDSGEWIDIDEKDAQSTDNIMHSLTFDALAEGNQVPDGAVTINIKGEPYKVDLNDGDFYKIIEIVPPDGYEGSNLTFTDEYPDLKSLLIAYAKNPDSFKDSDYYNFLKNFVSTHYIEYGTKKLSQYPDGVTSGNLIKVSTGGSVNIYDNQLINVKSEKTWDREDHYRSKVKVELLWSYTKSPTGIPIDAKQANAESLGLLDSSFSYEKEILSNESAIWEDLPSGINGRPIYYYVKEVGYTLDYTTGNAGWYNLQSDGTYKNESGEIGSYKPIYIGNALNKGDKDSDDSTGTVSINNTEGLTVKKLWVYSNGTPMEAESIPLDKITYKLYGITQNSQQVELYTGTLTSDGNWKEVVPSEYLKDEYVSYRVEEYLEDLTAEEKLQLYGYKISCTGVSNGNTGEFTITNKNNTPSEIEVNVEKEWGDGNELHQLDSIKIKLYKSSRSLSDKEIEALSKGTLPSDNTVSTVENGEVTLYAGNQWKHTWSDLAYKDENVSRYFYYPVEIDMTVSDTSKQYTPSYARVDKAATQSVKIRNTVPGGLTVNKSWVNDKGEEITNGLPEEIVVELYKRLQGSASSGGDDTSSKNLPSSLKVISVGDSITDGFWTSSDDYPHRLESLLKNDGVIQEVGNYGISGQVVSEISSRISKQGSGKWSQGVDYIDTNVMCIIAGTNDINKGNWELYGEDNTERKAKMKAAVKQMIQTAYQNANTSDFVVLLGCVPYEDFVNSDGSVETNINYCSAHTALAKSVGVSWVDASMGAEKAQEFENGINKMIDSYNDMLKEVVSELQQDEATKTIKFVDAYAKKIKDNELLYDGVHPDSNGYVEIANAFYDAINVYYGVTSSTTSTNAPVNIDDCPTDLTESEKVGEYTITPDENGNWSLTISDLEKSDGKNDYVYYIKEKPVNGWDTSYKANGQIISDEDMSPITLINTKVTESLDITVKKKWNDGNGNGRPDSLTLQLQQKLGENGDWNNYDYPTPSPDPEWTYSYVDLPSENDSGEKYYYRVVEVVPDGYVLTSEVNNDGISIDSEDKTVELTNTITLSMKIKKEWADGQNHEADSVTVNIHRSTNPSDAPIVTTISAETQTTSTTKNTTTTTTVKTVPSTTTSTSMSTTTSVITTTITTTTTNGGGGDVVTGSSITVDDSQQDVTIDVDNKNISSITLDFDTSEMPNDSQLHMYLGGWNAQIDIIFRDGEFTSSSPNKIKNVTIDGNVVVVEFEDGVNANCSWDSNKNNKITLHKNNGTIYIDSYTINYASSNTYSLRRSASFYSSRANDALVGEAEWTGNTASITLKFTDNWEKLITNLPAYDEEGNPYYYWVEEDEKSAAGFEVSYKYDDGDNDTDFCINAINPGDNPTATIRNKVVNTSVTMPSTGGKGTTWYYITGTVILLSSSAAYYLIKRRWKFAEK